MKKKTKPLSPKSAKAKRPNDLQKSAGGGSDTKWAAVTSAMDYLARRNHSELELRQRLSRKYDISEVDHALGYCLEQNWFGNPESLSEQIMNALHRQKKGFLFIQGYLKKRGLPVPARTPEIEEQKAKELLERKFGEIRDSAQKQKAHRFLKSRGFENNVIRKVLYANVRA